MPIPILLLITPFSPEALVPLEAHFEIVDWRTLPSAEDFCATHGSRVHVIITNGMAGVPELCRTTMDNVALIACNGVGYDAIDMNWANSRQIRVTNTPDVLSADVADWAIALTLAAFRRLPAADRFVREGRWNEGPFPLASRFWGSKVGILGLGRIGRLIAQRAAAFDTEVAYCSRRRQADVPYPYFPNAASLAEYVDVLIVTTPGGDGTHHLVSRPELDALGPDGVLINVARGSVVNQGALIEYLEAGKIGAAALDVFENEPNVPERLRASPLTVLAPHVASATVETRQAMAALVVNNILCYVQGQPVISPVN